MNPANLTVQRSELKYYVSNTQCFLLAARLQHVLTPDEHSKPGIGYFIRSLYFDSADDKCLHEKQSGLLFRKKYRLRIYDTAAQTVKFEIKNKFNNQIFKESAILSRESAKRIIDGEYEELLKYQNPVLNKAFIEFSSHLYRPKVIVDYDRDAFVGSFFNLRVTMDKNLKSNNSDFDIFSSTLQTIPVILEGKQILEIKYNEVFPDYVRGIVQPGAFERCAISKYTLGRRFIKHNKWEDN